MSDFAGEIQAFFTGERVMMVVRALTILIGGGVFAGLASRAAGRFVMHRSGVHSAQLVRRAVRYIIFGAAVLATISALGFDLSILLGAAGILSVAIGFASQSSAANVISGAFLIGERAFEVGDTIIVGQTTGEVLSVDLLSVKLRTFDNVFVRIPNELLLKTEIRNLSRFPIRRLDMPLTIAYATDLDRVRSILAAVAERHPYVLDEPKPLILFTGFGDNGYTLQYSVWAARERFVEVRGSLHGEVVTALAEAQISIAMPRIAIYPGPGAEPFTAQLKAIADPATTA